MNKDLYNFVKSKLEPKIKLHLKMNGKSDKVDLSYLIEKVVELGQYEIIWNYDLDKVIGIKQIYGFCNVELHINGRYMVVDKNGSSKLLYSSEFIEFSLKEFREYKLNKILHIKN